MVILELSFAPFRKWVNFGNFHLILPRLFAKKIEIILEAAKLSSTELVLFAKRF